MEGVDNGHAEDAAELLHDGTQNCFEGRGDRAEADSAIDADRSGLSKAPPVRRERESLRTAGGSIPSSFFGSMHIACALVLLACRSV